MISPDELLKARSASPSAPSTGDGQAAASAIRKPVQRAASAGSQDTRGKPRQRIDGARRDLPGHRA